jgi:hyperosmotically inducible periplasmic protein
MEKPMNMNFRNSALTAAIAIGLFAGTAAVSAASASQEVIDARQESQIWTTYALSPYLRANDIHVVAHNGKVTLTGKVEEDVNKDLAKQIALGVSGVTSVDNQILVAADYVEPSRPSDRRYGEKVDDATITSAIKSKLMWSKHTNGLATDVDTSWGKVTLTGSAHTQAAKDLASRLAWNTRGVVAVNNKLVVASMKPKLGADGKTPMQEAASDVADSWITTKVKSTFMYSSNVNGSDISVSTNKGVVTLSGKMNNGTERALAIELAQNVNGVKSVQSKGLTI